MDDRAGFVGRSFGKLVSFKITSEAWRTGYHVNVISTARRKRYILMYVEIYETSPIVEVTVAEF
jgi:hypothetical protein